MFFTWIYLLSNGMFLRGGPCEMPFNAATEGSIKLARHPNPQTERYDAVTGIRPASGAEISAYIADYIDQCATQDFNNSKLLKAFAVWAAGKLGVTVNQMKSEVIAIYKTL
jgi:hypothetical protein